MEKISECTMKIERNLIQKNISADKGRNFR